MSSYVHTLKVGASVEVRGPVGRFKYEKNAYKRIGLVAGGTGIYPHHPKLLNVQFIFCLCGYGNIRNFHFCCFYDFMYYFKSYALDTTAFNYTTMLNSIFYTITLGLTPCLQVIRCILESPEYCVGEKTCFSLLFQNRSEEDILLRDELDGLQKNFPDRLQIFYYLSNPKSSEFGMFGV